MANFFKDKLGIDIPIRKTVRNFFSDDEEEKKKQGMVFRVGENLTEQQKRIAETTVRKPTGYEGSTTGVNFFKDFVKSIPKAVEKVNQKAIVEPAQGIARNVASLGITAYNNKDKIANAALAPLDPLDMFRTKLTQKFRSDNPTQVLEPDNFLHKAVFGNDPVKSIELRAQENKKNVQEFGGAHDIPFLQNSKVAGVIGLGMPVLSIAGDLTGGGKKEGLQIASKVIAEAKEVSVVAKALKGLGIADEVVATLAPKLTKVDDVEKVFKELNSLNKERGFLTSVKNSPQVSTATKTAVDELPDAARTYQTITDADSVARAQKRVGDNEAEALSYVLTSKKPEKDVIATGVELMRNYRKVGNTKAEVEVAAKLAEDLTSSAQTVQAASLLGKLSPDGVLVYAQRQIKAANTKRLFPQLRKAKELTEESATKLKELAVQADIETNPILKAEKEAEISGALSALTGSSTLKKISTVQTIAQLLNPKTIVRNTLGNEIFWRLERVNKYIATPIDMARSAITGADRTITFRTGEGVWNGFYRSASDYASGLKKGAIAGVRGDSVVGTQADIAPGLVFKSKYNPATWFEKGMRASLQGFDYASFNRARNTTIKEMAWLQAINAGKKGEARLTMARELAEKVDDSVMEIADEYGKYVTYQDDNIISRGLSGVKRGLNFGKEFGLGDMIIKYPKTPGAILMRGLEYSPVGILKGMYELSSAFARGRKVNNELVTNALSRSITGSLGLTAMGYFLADKGVITGKAEEDYDIQATEKETGKTRYQVNISALKRLVTSGFKDAETKEGDFLYNYDWAQPVALMLSIGANANKNQDEGKGLLSKEGIENTALDSLTGGVQTLAEQPVLAGIGKLIGNPKGIKGVGEDIIKQLPASFSPSVVNQINQYTDNTVRATYDPSVLNESWNRVKAKIPGLAQSLPARRTVFGEEEQRFQDGTNGFANVFLNPGFIKKYKEDPEIKMVMDIYEQSGETKQAPRVVPTSQAITVDKKTTTRKISSQEQEAMQIVVGKLTQDIFRDMATGAQSEKFLKEPPDKQAKILADILADISQAAKIQIIGHRPDSTGVSERAKKYSGRIKQTEEFQDYLFTRTK